MEPDKSEDSLGLEEVERRPKKRKAPIEVFLKLPDSAIQNLTPDVIEELQAAYEILQTILKMSRIESFLVKPDPALFGMSAYYTVVKEPMWLDEVHRKLLEGEYKNISEFVADIRLMLENCYRFWGSSHKFTRKGLRIEHKLEQKIDALPEYLKKKCSAEDGCLGQIVVKSEDMEIVDENDKLDDTDFIPSIYKGFHSKILNKVLDSEEHTMTNEMSCEAQQERETKMLSWEKDTLVTEEHREQIKSMWQLAEIGHFLKLTYEVLNVDEITQYELERMLIMPRESITLSTLMTSMLSPAAMRGNLDITPIMPYELWTKRLKKKLDDWFGIFYKKCGFVETYEVCGIDPHFWLAMSLQNPLEESKFHELTFFQRVWILKSLCNNLLHTNRSIQDLFSDEANLIELRPSQLGRDSEGYIYFHLPFFPEIRVYKQKDEKAPYWEKLNIKENLVIRSFDSSVLYTWDELDQEMTITPNNKDFCVVADDMDSLKELIESLKKDNSALSKSLTRFSKEANKYMATLEGLDALYSQWDSYQKRPSDYVEKYPVYPNNIIHDDSNKSVDEVPVVLGKRKSKLNLSFINMEMDSSDEFDRHESESDISEWECEPKKKKKSKRKTKQSECNELAEEKKSIQDDVIDEPVPPMTIDYDIKPPTSPIAQINYNEVNQDLEVKPVINKDGFVTKQLVPFMNSTANNRPKETQSKPQSNSDVKQEKEDDVISISSEEELDVKPNITDLNINKTPTLKSVLTQQNINSPNKVRMTSPAQPTVVRLPSSPVRQQWPQPIQVNSPNSPRQNVMFMSPGKMNFNMGHQNLTRTPPQSPRTRTPSPMQAGSRVRSPYTPRQRSPSVVSPGRGGMSPRGVGPLRSPRAGAPRNLFPNTPQQLQVPKLEGNLAIGQKPDGSYGYHVKLPDGGIIPLSREEVDEIKRKNRGTLPHKVEVASIKKPPPPLIE